MKHLLILFLSSIILLACQANESKDSKRIAGKWQLVSEQDSTGNWQDIQYTTYLMHIFANNSIEITNMDGLKPLGYGCCSPLPYKLLEGNKIILQSGGDDCSRVRVMCSTNPNPPSASLPNIFWNIIRADSQLMEIDTGNQLLLRFKKIN